MLVALALGAAGGAVVGRAQAPPTVGAARPLGMLVSDSELVMGLTLYRWDTAAFVAEQGGYLATYREAVDGEVLSGAQIVTRVAEDYSIGPRLLLALVEMHSGWVRDPEPAERTFPLDEPLPGLFAALASAADQLNADYYGYRRDGLRAVTLRDGLRLEVGAPNAGSFALLAYLSREVPLASWATLDAPSRFYTAWTSLFGDAYQYLVAETRPETLPAEDLRLPFPPGEVWFLVAGPHSAWGAGGPRSAIDLAPPPTEATGCEGSVYWATAVADGVVTRARASGVVVDADHDGFEGSGWVHVYGHLASADRVAPGTEVRAGDRLGHPSCEGGLPTQTRVSFARRFNGEWIPADEPDAPLVLGGWTAIVGPEPGLGWLSNPAFGARRPAQVAKRAAVNGVAALPGAP